MSGAFQLGGDTRVAAVIGSPVGHSLSPAIHNAAFRECGLDWVYVGFDVSPQNGLAAVAAMRTLNLGGMSVTTPLKELVAQSVDRCTAVAQRLGGVNCVSWDGEQLVGDSTDGNGFCRAIASDPGFAMAGSRIGVIGAGPAARSLIESISRQDPAELLVVNRTAARAQTAAALGGPRCRVAQEDELSDCDLIINATSVGMGEDPSIPIDPKVLRRGQMVTDIVYHPLETPLLRATRAAGGIAVNGLGMLVGQAALAFEQWTGVEAPVDAMMNAAKFQLSV